MSLNPATGVPLPVLDGLDAAVPAAGDHLGDAVHGLVELSRRSSSADEAVQQQLAGRR